MDLPARKPEVTYRALLGVPGFGRMALGSQLGRIGGTMAQISLVLFVLGHFHSPTLAGLTEFLAIFPGLLIAPLAGALLDRHGRVRLVTADFVVAALCLALIGVLGLAGRLPAWLLLVIVGLSSLTSPLSSTGLRSLYPLMVPSRLWERANAIDSNGYIVASIFGPALAGLLVGLAGGPVAIISTALFFVAAAVVVRSVPEPDAEIHSSGSLLRDAWLGLVHVVVQNATLRGVAVLLFATNLAQGILVIALPVLILQRLHQGPGTVGLLYTTMGVAAFFTVLLAGRMRTDGRERQMLVASLAATAAGMALLPFAQATWLVFVAMAVLGIAVAPFDVAFFTLRQRRTHVSWIGRAFAVSMALNFSGQPIGAALAGPLIGVSLTGALVAAVLITLIAAPLPLLLIPATAAPLQSADGQQDEEPAQKL